MDRIQSFDNYQARHKTEVPDVVIVGSGPAGYFSALRLAERGQRVVVLEAGQEQPDLDANRYFEMGNDGFPKRRANLGLSWQVGGASNLWSGRVAPLEDRDISPETGWPYGYTELAPYYDSAATIIGVSPMSKLSMEGTDIKPGTEWAKVVEDAAISIKRFQWSAPPFNTGSALADAVIRFPNLSVVSDARVLAFDGQGADGAITHVTLATSDGTRHRLTAKSFILAAGGIESPRILLNSRDGSGIGNRSGMVGAYFSTHPKMNIGTLELTRPVSVASPLFRDLTRGDKSLRFGMGVEPRSGGRDMLNHYVQFSQRFEKIGTYAIEEAQRFFSAANGRSQDRKGVIRGAIVHAAITLGRIVFNALGRTGVWRKRASVLTLRAFFDQYPSRENRITLSEKTDPLGVPKAQVQWDLSAEDVASIRQFAADLGDVFARHNIGTLRLALPDDPHTWPLTSVHSHFMGTLRMGTNPDQSVTDPDGRLHDVPNVYICGSSVLPSYGYANPFLTIAAMSLRTADHMPSPTSGYE